MATGPNITRLHILVYWIGPLAYNGGPYSIPAMDLIAASPSAAKIKSVAVGVLVAVPI